MVLIGSVGHAGTWWVIAASFALTVAVCPIVFARYANPTRSAERVGLRTMVGEVMLLSRDRELRQACVVDFWVAATKMYQSTFIVAIGSLTTSSIGWPVKESTRVSALWR